MAEEAGPILVVDDDDGARAGSASLLEAAGFSIAEAETGEAALALARTVQPRVALVDVFLPGLSGYEVCHRLKTEFGEACRSCSSRASGAKTLDRVAGVLLGADDCVTSPVARDELLSLVERLLERMPDLRPQS